MIEKIVYDFGAHNGSNIPYYLAIFDKVIAVEANPTLSNEIVNKFKNEIDSNRLVVLNNVISLKSEMVDFYIHEHNSVLSQFPVPSDIENFKKIYIESKTPSEIINTYGDPEYVKIDVEHTDAEILKDLFINKIFPRYISAEVHDVTVFSLLTSSNVYNSYKILDGKSISSIYENININEKKYSFPFHSAGPMFEDIKSPELNKEQLFYLLAEERLGWKDIHAKRSY